MVFHKHRIVFTGIAKNASTSIFQLLESKTDNDHNHRHYSRDYERNDPDLLDTYKSIAVVRNPYDRFVSACHQIIRDQSLESLDYNSIIQGEIENFPYVNDVFTPQHKYITYAGKIVIDHILKFENLAKDWEDFAKEHNKTAQFKIKNVLPYENYAIQRESWLEGINTLTPYNKAWFNEYYHKDFVLFGYDKLDFENEE